MVIFNSYVSLPEGRGKNPAMIFGVIFREGYYNLVMIS
jgi:hypothetical protein